MPFVRFSARRAPWCAPAFAGPAAEALAGKLLLARESDVSKEPAMVRSHDAGHDKSPAAVELSVVVPVYNEVENIASLLAEIHAALSEAVFEVIYVDDGSTDGTARELERLQGLDPCLRVVRHRARAGQSAALWSGARAARAAWLATLDGDGQNDPRDILRCVDFLAASGAGSRLDLIAGIRVKRQDNWLRRVSSRVANRVRSRLLGDGVFDTGCGLKLIRRDAFLALPYFDHMHRFLPALIRRGGGEVATRAVNHRPRRRGASKYGLFDRLGVGIVDLLGVMWLQRRAANPERIEIEPAPRLPMVPEPKCCLS
jgi:dolichol-phosphate mannosyltransferase